MPSDFVGNKTEGQISIRVFQENKACQIFRKTNIVYLLVIPHKDISATSVKLSLPILCISESYIEIKIKVNFYFDTLWCLKRFYEGLKASVLKKPFAPPQKKCQNKNLP